MQQITAAEGRLADRTASYKSEISNQTRLIELLERRNDQSRARLEEVEKEWEQMVHAAQEREERLSVETESQRSRADRLQRVVEELQANQGTNIDQTILAFEDSGDTSFPPLREQTAFGLSPAAGVAAKLQKSGKSFTEVYAEYVRLQEDLVWSRSEERRVKELLSQVLADIEERVSDLHVLKG